MSVVQTEYKNRHDPPPAKGSEVPTIYHLSDEELAHATASIKKLKLRSSCPLCQEHGWRWVVLPYVSTVELRGSGDRIHMGTLVGECCGAAVQVTLSPDALTLP